MYKIIPSTVACIKTIPSILLTTFLLLFLIVLLGGCTITHEYGKLKKIRIDNSFADETSLKLKGDKVELKMKWEI